MPRRKEPHIPDAILDQLLAGADPKTAFDPNGLLDGLKKALAERALNAEMDHHLAREETGNSRNGYGRKSVITDTGKLGRVDGFEDDEAKSKCDEGCKVLVRFLATERNALEALELTDEVFDTGAGSIECLREERWPVLGR